MITRCALGLVFMLISIQVLSQTTEFLSPADVFKAADVLSDSGKQREVIALLRKIDPRDTAFEAARLRMIYAFIAANEPDSAVRAAQQLLREPSTQRSEYLRIQAVALAKTDYNRAVELLEQAVRKYPTVFYLRYSLAAIHFDNKQFEKATQECFKVLEINPYYSSAHKLLSRMAVLQGHKVHAMMAMGIYLGISPSDNAALVLLDQLVDNQVSDEGSITPFSVNGADRLDRMIRAKIIMSGNFKSAFPISAPVVKQFELLFDQLGTLTQNSGDEYLARYLTVYKSIKNGSEVEPFIYHILTSADIDAAKRWRDKNEKVLSQFYKTVNAALSESRINLAFPDLGFQERTNTWYDNSNRVSAIGTFKDEKRLGHWVYLHPNGEKSAEGTFRDTGVKGGVWNYYYDNGRQKSIENMDTGEVTVYSKKGDKTEHFFLKGEKIDGQAEIFYRSGERNKLISFVGGERHGKQTDYYADGSLAATFHYIQGKINGPYEFFHPNGKIKTRTTFKDDYYNGKYEEYHTNGFAKSTGEYTAGEMTGNWKFYHSNGRLSREGLYSPKGKLVGEWKYYDHLGTLTEKTNFDSDGRFDGTSVGFEEGKQKFVWEYKKDVLVKHTSFSPEGKVIFTAGNSNGTFYAKIYDMDGTLRREGNYSLGRADGLWKYYNRYGTLVREYRYKGNGLHGKATDYYWNGNVQSEVNYENGDRNGRYVYYSLSGKVLQEGWYVKGKAEQKWLSYFADGSLETDGYYIGGELAGKTTDFAVDGKRHMAIVYSGDLVDDEISYDSKGNTATVKRAEGTKLIYEQFFGNGKLKARDELLAGHYTNSRVAYYPDGSVHYDNAMLYNTRHGSYVYYYPNGQQSVKGQFEDGLKTGIWERYHENGKLFSIGKYVSGQEDSVWTFFDDHGVMTSKGVRKEGQRHGAVSYYNPNGKIVLEKRFYYDEVVAYRSMTGTTPGEWKVFTGTGNIDIVYPDGKPAWHQEFKNGLLQGLHREFYANGTLHEESQYVDGDREGYRKVFYENGKLKEQEHFKNDELNGTRELYGPDGDVVYSAQYRNGYLQGKFVFYEHGKEIRKYSFWHGTVEQ